MCGGEGHHLSHLQFANDTIFFSSEDSRFFINLTFPLNFNPRRLYR